ncbi:MAG: NAD-binding protein [Bacteroidota bacterium]
MLHLPSFDRIPATILRPKVARYLFLGVLLIGTAGFCFIEGYSVIDGIYMTIITFSTVGFGEVEPLSNAGRIFVSVLIILNTLVLAYILAAFSYYIIEGKIFHSMHASSIRSKIDQLSDHVIICGFGRYGQEIGMHLRQHGQPYVVIDLNMEAMEQLAVQESDLLYLVGDATEDEILQAAGIDRAKGLISALVDDGDNMFIVITARQLNPRLRIVSRAQQVRSEDKLKKVGANHVIMPERMGGFYMAALMSKPQAVEFFSFITSELSGDIGFEEIHYQDLRLEDRQKPLKDLHYRRLTGINIIGHRHQDGSYQVNPDAEASLNPGESFIALGSSKQLSSLRKLLKEQ